MITGSINVVKINKARLVDGKKGEKYLSICLIETPNNAYDQDYMIVESVTKEEREAGTRGAILGNAKIMGKGKVAATKPTTDSFKDDGSDVPF